MRSEYYVKGMVLGAEFALKDLYWFQFIKRARIKTWIKVCQLILKDKEDV